MAPPDLHPGNLLTLAADPQRMEAARPTFNKVVEQAFIPHKADIEKMAVLVGLATTADDKPFFATEIIQPVADSKEMKPVLATLHFVARSIFDLIKGSAPDDDVAFDSAAARVSDLFKQRAMEPQLVTIYVETAIAAIHSQFFADMMITTLYSDGRLMALKGSVLQRMLSEHRQSLTPAS
ncbi:MAG: hypothetical protein ABI439_02020 [Rhodospirillales bacterium]